MTSPAPRRTRIVVVGGGFAGLTLVRALRGAPVDVTLVDRRNFHLFQPLLYQVATGGLSPGEHRHAAPRVLASGSRTSGSSSPRRPASTSAAAGAARGRRAAVRHLVLATGAPALLLRPTPSGRPRAPGLKTLEDATGSAPASSRPSRRPSARRTRRGGARSSRSSSSAAGPRGSSWPGPSPRSPGTRSGTSSAGSTPPRRGSSSSRDPTASCGPTRPPSPPGPRASSPGSGSRSARRPS